MTSSSYTGLQDETSAQKHPASRSHLHKVADQGSESDPLLDADATGLLRPESRQQAKIARYQFAAICWCLYLAGWNDGSIGPLLPRIKAEYEVRVQFLLIIIRNLKPAYIRSVSQLSLLYSCLAAL